MTENITFVLDTVFEEIVEQGLMNGVFNEAGYHDLVEDVIEEHRRLGELADDQNYETYIAQLKERWPEYQKRVAE